MKARTERHEATATCPGGATVIETTLLLAKVAAGTTDPPRLRTMVPADMLPIGIRRPSAGKAASTMRSGDVTRVLSRGTALYYLGLALEKLGYKPQAREAYKAAAEAKDATLIDNDGPAVALLATRRAGP